ncbi:MAG: peptidoglycan-binding domain-containing protein [Bryobacteraceae bacterium]
MRNILAASVLGLSLCAIPVLSQSRDTVRDAQQALKDKGYDPGPVDGIDGPLTRAAVRDYQQKENINADGRLGAKTLDTLGVKHGSASTEFGAAGENLKHSYANGAKDMGHGTKNAGSDLKHGEVVDGAKDFGKGVGHGVGKMAVGTGHAVKNAAKGSKKAVTGDSNPHQ